MAGEDTLQIRITADFKEVESAFLNLGKTAKSFEGDIKRVAGSVSREFNKIEGTATLFGDASNVVKDKMDTLRSAMERLMAMGFQPANKYVQELKTKYDQLATSLVVVEKVTKTTSTVNTDAANALKKSNQQYTNFALVLQDLPYGFRGIQNNLPALMGGIAGLAGPLYLVGSAVIALFTAWDAGLFKTTNAISVLEKANKEYADSAKSAAGNAGEEIAKINALNTAATNNSLSMSKRLAAVKQLQDEYPAYFGNLSREQILNGDVATSVNNVKIAIIERAKATAVASKINKLSAEKFAKDEELYQLALIKTNKIRRALLAAEATGVPEDKIPELLQLVVKDVRQKENEIKSTVDTIDKELARLGDIYAASMAATSDLKTSNMPKPGKEPKEKKQKQDTFDLLKTTKEYYAAKLNFAEGDEIAQKEILLREKQTFDELILSNQISWSDYYNNISQIYKKLIDFQIKEDKRLYDAQVTLANNNIDNVKSKLGVELKLNKKNTVLQQDAIKKAMATLTVLAATSFNPEAIIAYQNAFANLQSQLEGFGGTGQKIADILNNTIANGVSAMAKSIGNAISTGTLDFTALGEVLATGLIQIGEALIAFALLENTAIQSLKNPALWPVALAAGIAAVVAGSLLSSSLSKDKTKKFANGGIISGPTMGLMGEYPGAQSNPEVVAPLDKLKDMIGGNDGGGGQFVLRGQDLLLSVNRAQKSSYLKGQNINLV